MSSNLYTRYKTSKVAENAGQWFKLYGPDDNGNVPRVRLARKSRSNKAYQNAMMEFGKKHERQLQSKTLSDEEAFDGMLKIFCKHILKDWEFIPDENGDYIDFSPENAEAYLRELPDLYDEWDALADDIEAFRAAQNEADAGN